MAAPVFLLEDDNDVAIVLRRALEEHGFTVERFSRRADMVRRLGAVRPSICLIDLGLPDGDGLVVVSNLLRGMGIPSIIVSGRGELSDRVVGLEIGADDYIVKPIEPRELIARVRSVLRRSQGLAVAKAVSGGKVARFKGWVADFSACSLTDPKGNVLELSASENALLKVFVESAGRVLTRSFLLDMDSPDDLEPYDRSVDIRVSRLRRKLNDDPKKPSIIRTVYGAGYVFSPKVEWCE